MLTLRFWVIAFFGPLTAFAQAAPDLQKVLDRLDQLEKQNQELLTEIHELRKELTTSAPAPPLVTPSERLDVQEARTAELAQSKVETSQRMPVSLTGMLLFNAFQNGKSGGGLQDPVSASLTPSAAASGATFRQTVLGLKFNGPDLPGGGKASGSFYMDFWGGTSAAGNNLFRIRLATLDLAWKNTTITVGQDKPIMSPREPVSLAQVGLAPLSGAGNLWLWQPQARIEQRISFAEDSGLRVQAGVYQTSESYPASAPAAFANSLEHARPAYQGRFDLYRGSENHRFEIAPGFSVSQTHVAGATIDSRLATLDWLARPISLIEFSGAFFHGQDSQGLGSLRQGFVILSSPSGQPGPVQPVQVNGGWAQIALFPTQRLSFHFYGGEEHDQNAALPANSISRNLTWAGNLIYKLAPNVLAALEMSQNRTDYITSGQRLNNHYDLALAYLF
jgi:hypothetical protein